MPTGQCYCDELKKLKSDEEDLIEYGNKISSIKELLSTAKSNATTLSTTISGMVKPNNVEDLCKSITEIVDNEETTIDSIAIQILALKTSIEMKISIETTLDNQFHASEEKKEEQDGE